MAEFTLDYILDWFKNYFESVRVNQGDLKTVPKLREFFASDLIVTMYSTPSSPPPKTFTRDELLMSFVHPGLQEDLIPNYYVVDLERMITVVQFEIQFKDIPSGKTWDSLQASAHYHLKVDTTGKLKIHRIHYWTEQLPVDLFEYWKKYREKALADYAISFLSS